jgi:DNA-binding NarL/FixJ family response regulator
VGLALWAGDRRRVDDGDTNSIMRLQPMPDQRGHPLHAGGSTLRVVLVEDSPDIRVRLAESLGEIPNLEIVGEAETERDAVALLTKGTWDALVLDLQLKQGTGLAVLKALGERSLKDGKVVVFTNYSFAVYRDKSMALGADFFFDKARDLQRLRDVLFEMATGESVRPH